MVIIYDMSILLLLNFILFYQQHRSTTGFSSLLVYLIYYVSVVQGKSPAGKCCSWGCRLRLRPRSSKKNVTTLSLNPRQTQVLAFLCCERQFLCLYLFQVLGSIKVGILYIGKSEDHWSICHMTPKVSWPSSYTGEGFYHSTSQDRRKSRDHPVSQLFLHKLTH